MIMLSHISLHICHKLHCIFTKCTFILPLKLKDNYQGAQQEVLNSHSPKDLNPKGFIIEHYTILSRLRMRHGCFLRIRQLRFLGSSGRWFKRFCKPYHLVYAINVKYWKYIQYKDDIAYIKLVICVWSVHPVVYCIYSRNPRTRINLAPPTSPDKNTIFFFSSNYRTPEICRNNVVCLFQPLMMIAWA